MGGGSSVQDGFENHVLRSQLDYVGAVVKVGDKLYFQVERPKLSKKYLIMGFHERFLEGLLFVVLGKTY